jgi:glycosyltransferase involved in cell wall biosynthesis
MKVLFIAPYAPNLIRVRPYQIIRSLLHRGHEITLATLWSNEEEQAQLQALSEMGAQVIAHPLAKWRSLYNTLLALPTPTPLQAVYCWHPGLAESLRLLLQDQAFDVIHVEHLRGAAFGLHAQTLPRRKGRPIPVVWDSVDCISHLFEQAAATSRSLFGKVITRLDLARTRRYEGYLVQQFDQVLVTSPTDKKALVQLAGVRHDEPTVQSDSGWRPLPIQIVPNGVDLDYFRPNGHEREAATLVYSGKMSYHANVTAALHLVRDIMPKVWAQRPAVNVCIVGKDPTADVQALATTNTSPTGRGQVVVTGTVPDLPPYLQRGTIAVAPLLYGAGIQNKVLEAMACSAPVIASPKACAALQVQPGHELLVAEDADTFARTILYLLDQPAQRQALGQAARAYVERHHSWNAVAAQLEQIYQNASERTLMRYT